MDLYSSKEIKTKKPARLTDRLLSLAVRTGLEPATPCVTGTYSNQLNYRTGYYVNERLHIFGIANLINISFLQNIFSIFNIFYKYNYIFLITEATLNPLRRLCKQWTSGIVFVNLS